MASLAEVTTQVKEGLKPVFDLVYPPRCPSCGVATATHGALCSDCWSELEFPSNSEDADGRVYQVISATLYNDISRKLILNFKHGGKIALAPLLARMMANCVAQEQDNESPPILVPVPLHRTRLWQRGYNQAALLARELARLGKGELRVDALVRRKRTPSLGHLSSEERHKILAGAIALRDNAKPVINARRIILVDDVVTSGATSQACVDALLAAGAREVLVLCFARADLGGEMRLGPKAKRPRP